MDNLDCFRNKMHVILVWASLMTQTINNLPAIQETRVRFLGQEDPLEKEEATHPVLWPGNCIVHGVAKSQT